MAYFGPAKDKPTSDEFPIDSPQGQRHDRLFSQQNQDTSTMASSKSDAGTLAADTSLSQKMLSAVSGSVLTSLLCMPQNILSIALLMLTF